MTLSPRVYLPLLALLALPFLVGAAVAWCPEP